MSLYVCVSLIVCNYFTIVLYWTKLHNFQFNNITISLYFVHATVLKQRAKHEKIPARFFLTTRAEAPQFLRDATIGTAALLLASPYNDGG